MLESRLRDQTRVFARLVLYPIEFGLSIFVVEFPTWRFPVTFGGWYNSVYLHLAEELDLLQKFITI